jgi:hypothetical protein
MAAVNCQETISSGKNQFTYFPYVFNKTALDALFNCGKLRTFVFRVTFFTMVTVVKKWLQLWDPLLHRYQHENGLLSMVTEVDSHFLSLTGANFAFTSEI